MYEYFREKLHVNHLRGKRVKESAGLTRGVEGGGLDIQILPLNPLLYRLFTKDNMVISCLLVYV